MKEEALEQLLRELSGPPNKPDLWWACAYVTKARRVPEGQRQLVLLVLASTLIRHRVFLELAETILFEAERIGDKKYELLLVRSRLAAARGARAEAKRLAGAARRSPDAPSPSSRFITAWVKREVKIRKKDLSPEGRRVRLNTALKTAAELKAREQLALAKTKKPSAFGRWRLLTSHR
ncbi:MAG: hypothetical protein ACO1OB_05550 [Archangium sp.]